MTIDCDRALRSVVVGILTKRKDLLRREGMMSVIRGIDGLTCDLLERSWVLEPPPRQPATDVSERPGDRDCRQYWS